MEHKITKKGYLHRLNDAAYDNNIRRKAKALKSDGCTGVVDIYRLACLEHDIAYRTGKDPYGFPISRKEADKRFRWHMQFLSPLGVLSPASWLRWAGVRVLACNAYKGIQ